MVVLNFFFIQGKEKKSIIERETVCLFTLNINIVKGKHANDDDDGDDVVW